jgi:uncharacterized cupin superfamily protein
MTAIHESDDRRELRITRTSESIYRDKGDGTCVNYYIFPEYEIHYNEVAPGTRQQWHYHKIIDEAIYVIAGELEAHWTLDGRHRVDRVRQGDIVHVGTVNHTLVNRSDGPCRFLVVRTVPDGVDKRSIIQNDKFVDAPHPSVD